MLGCGTCRRCTAGYQHVCEWRQEVGIRGGRAGALAEQVAVPVTSLHWIPTELDATAGALVEPAANALRAVDGADLRSGDRALVIGPGTIGLLAAMFAAAAGAEVHLLGRNARWASRGRSGSNTRGTSRPFPHCRSTPSSMHPTPAPRPPRPSSSWSPAGGSWTSGSAGAASLIDTRLVDLKDVTAVGALSASPGLAGAIEAFGDRRVDPRALVAATVGLDEVAGVLAGHRPAGAGAGPKIHVDPRAR